MMPNNRNSQYGSWGRRDIAGQQALVLRQDGAVLPSLGAGCRSLLPYGNGRSYGDSCQNDGGYLLDSRARRKVIAFDTQKGLITCETGLLLSDLLTLVIPAGWFPAVTPGTKYVTIGGAIANDVHGKNHHVTGTFGRFVTSFELLRSDGTARICSASDNANYFNATIGGLGLTGLITWAQLQLIPLQGPWIAQNVVRFRGLSDFEELSHRSDETFDYSVAWIDSLATGKALGRGLYIRGNHAPVDQTAKLPIPKPSRTRLRVPMTPPFSLINRTSLKLFNALYYRKQWRDQTTSIVHYEPFFYPLDGILDWNKLYGPKGLLQHQCSLPECHPESEEAPVSNKADNMDVVRELIERTQKAKIGSFLTVLKRFGDAPSPGLLSFPQPGLTLTLDFANSGPKTLALLDELDAVVSQAGGRVNPYKDARMSAASYQSFFPQWRQLKPFIDPAFSSSFWRRVT